MKRKIRLASGKIVYTWIEHKQILVKYINGNIIDIDEGMEDILSRIWKRGYETLISCEEHSDRNSGLDPEFYVSMNLEVYQKLITDIEERNPTFLQLIRNSKLKFIDKIWTVMMRVPISQKNLFIEEWDKTFE